MSVCGALAGASARELSPNAQAHASGHETHSGEGDACSTKANTGSELRMQRLKVCDVWLRCRCL
eukprot:2801642-Rhodomonas_salina.2